MSSWVAPSIAAEYWQKSVDDVLRCIKDGSLAVRREGDFTFVDIAPDIAGLSPASLPKPLRPPTFVMVSQAERDALLEEPSPDAELVEMATEAIAQESISYHHVRAATSTLRRRPLAA